MKRDSGGPDPGRPRQAKKGQAMSLSVVTWNVEWATPAPLACKAPEILARIKRYTPEVVCLTESHADLLGADGHTICSQPDFGLGIKGARRKVLLWSAEQWEQVDYVGIASLPPGRFVSGVTRTSLGEITVVGICISWWAAGIKAGLKKPWQDHEQYLAGLTKVLARAPKQRLIVMGDFNQIIGPRTKAPKKLQDALQHALSGMTIVSRELFFNGKPTIDHIALSDDLAAESVEAISNIHKPCRLSDHFGVAARLSVTSG